MMEKFSIAEPSYKPIKEFDDYLYPELAPFSEDFLPVSSVHSLWFAQYGNPRGIPALVVHGGPGGGCGPFDMRLFDPEFYRIILVDQRGAGRSRPTASTIDNTTNDLIADMEIVRRHLGVSRWLLVGGSWGSALSLAYGETHPQSCLGFVLRGIFLGTKDEYMKLWNGMGDIYPEAFEEYVNFLPAHERDRLLENYYKRLIDDDRDVHMPAARSFYKYDMTCATLVDKSHIPINIKNDDRVLALSRLFAHYCMNDFALTPDQLISNLSTITHLPASIVQGRYDVICRASSAFRLHKAWPLSELTIVPDAGHATKDPGITKALVEAIDNFKARLS